MLQQPIHLKHLSPFAVVIHSDDAHRFGHMRMAILFLPWGIPVAVSPSSVRPPVSAAPHEALADCHCIGLKHQHFLDFHCLPALYVGP